MFPIEKRKKYFPVCGLCKKTMSYFATAANIISQHQPQSNEHHYNPQLNSHISQATETNKQLTGCKTLLSTLFLNIVLIIDLSMSSFNFGAKESNTMSLAGKSSGPSKSINSSHHPAPYKVCFQ
jgi:hypothetical protein